MYYVELSPEEIGLLINSNLIPSIIRERLNIENNNKSGSGITVSFKDDEILEFINICQDGCVIYGTDEKYNSNKEGEIWDGLVIRLTKITNT